MWGHGVSGARKAPHARDRMIGAQLRFIRRERTGLSLEAAAELAELAPATMSRIENGKRHISSEDVAALLAIYRAPSAQRAALIDAARTAGQAAGQWQRSLPGVLPDANMSSHETGACTVISWSVAVVPSLLQTPAYAIGVLVADGIPRDEAERSWNARLHRQARLQAADHTAFVHEFALRTAFGGRAALKEQLLHLTRAAGRGVGVRLVGAGAPLAALGHSWTMLGFPKDPPIVHVELHGSSVFLHDSETAAYERQSRQLRRVACSVAETKDILTRMGAAL